MGTATPSIALRGYLMNTNRSKFYTHTHTHTQGCSDHRHLTGDKSDSVIDKGFVPVTTSSRSWKQARELGGSTAVKSAGDKRRGDLWQWHEFDSDMDNSWQFTFVHKLMAF